MCSQLARKKKKIQCDKAQSPGESIGVIWAEISLYLYYTPCLFQAVAWFSWSDMWEWGQSQGQKPWGKLKAGGMFASLWLACPNLGNVSAISESSIQSQCYLAIEKCYFYQSCVAKNLAWNTFTFCDMVSFLLFLTTVCLSIIRADQFILGTHFRSNPLCNLIDREWKKKVKKIRERSDFSKKKDSISVHVVISVKMNGKFPISWCVI